MSGFSAAAKWGLGAGVCALLAVAGCSGHGPPAALAPAQWAPDSATVRVAPGPQYARSAGWCFFWGTHYRAIWATPVRVPVLRLATAVPGGLRPLQAGGSYQTHTLRLRDSTGSEFVLRSVDKDMARALPAGWMQRLLAGLMKDQTSITLPYGAYVAARLAASAGVYHTNPRLVYVADDPGLGPFRAEFGRALYLFEERAAGNEQGRASFGHSPAVVNSHRMLLALRQRPDARVAARNCLRARLLDIWVGDWSRREDQWRWASFRQGDGTVFWAIPRDRDQAFFRFDDGVVPTLASWFLRKFQTFHGRIRPLQVQGLTTTARALDKTLLAGLGPADFAREAAALRARLPDSAIAHALQAVPAETRAPIAAWLEPRLRARRAGLVAVAQQYYALLNREAWVVGTDAPERFVVSADGAGRVRVRLLACRTGHPDSLLLDRTYDPQQTHQVDLYGLAGNDVFELQPPLQSSIMLNIYDGAGRDQIQTPARYATELLSVHWLGRSDGDMAAHAARHPQPRLNATPDPHPELTTNATAWLKRYNLRD